MTHTGNCGPDCPRVLYDEEAVECDCPCHNEPVTTMTAYTPGPWIARKGDVLNANRAWGIVTEWTRKECDALDDPPNADLRTTVIAEVMSGDTDEADARLIAAAPDLLAALNEIIVKYESDTDDLETMDAGIKIARAAIRKAQGE